MGHRYGICLRRSENMPGFELPEAEASKLPIEIKIKIIKQLLGDNLGDNLEAALAILGCEVQQDPQGQIVLFTDMAYGWEDEIIPFAHDDQGDPCEMEEEPEDSVEETPPTLKASDLLVYIDKEGFQEERAIESLEL